MANQTTANLTNSIRVQYLEKYIEGAYDARLYDQFSTPLPGPMGDIKKGSSVQVDFLSLLEPSEQTISETTDITPNTFEDAKATVSWTSRANAIVVSEKLLDQVYTNFNAEYYSRLGQNMQESLELVCKKTALFGGLLRAVSTTRAAQDAGTATHNLGRAAFVQAAAMLSAMKAPMFQNPGQGRWIALMHPFTYTDLLNDAVVLAVGEYQDKEIVFNYELGQLLGFKIISAPSAHVFWGTGTANGTAFASTVAVSRVKRLATSVECAAIGACALGMRLTLGSQETVAAATLYPTTESIIVTGIASNVITFVGEGPNGGLKHDHELGEYIGNPDSVYPILYGGPESIAKVYSPTTGPYGQIVGPKKAGLADQFTSLAWKWYGGYSIIGQNRLLRGEYSTSMEK
jgi:N4-gp56 family major capsid protein